MAAENKTQLRAPSGLLLQGGPRHNAYEDLKTTDHAASFNSFSGADIRVLIAVPATIEKFDDSGVRRYREAIERLKETGNIEGFDFSNEDLERLSDIQASDTAYIELNNLQTLSYSIYREKAPVRALGFVGEKGRARGTRTIAGSIVFTVFDRHVLWDVMRIGQGDRTRDAVSPDSGYMGMEYVLPDQLPPFDIIIHFVNEYGHSAEMVLFGIELHQEGQTMSIQDIITENVMQFTAQHIAIMRPGGYKKAAFYDNIGISPKTFNSIMNQGAHSGQLNELIKSSFNQFR